VRATGDDRKNGPVVAAMAPPGRGGTVGLTYISVAIGVAIALWCAWYCRRLAAEKGYNVLLWTVLGLVLTVLAAPVLVLLPDAAEEGATSSGPADPAAGE